MQRNCQHEYTIYRFVINGAKMCVVNAPALAIFWRTRLDPLAQCRFGFVGGPQFSARPSFLFRWQPEKWLHRSVLAFSRASDATGCVARGRSRLVYHLVRQRDSVPTRSGRSKVDRCVRCESNCCAMLLEETDVLPRPVSVSEPVRSEVPAAGRPIAPFTTSALVKPPARWSSSQKVRDMTHENRPSRAVARASVIMR